MPVPCDFAGAQFDDAVRTAGRIAFNEAIESGLPVFYVDADGLNVMEQDERRFEIRWVSGAPCGENFQILRELTAHAA